jgi:RNA polymerase sigma-70 factor (ECF subfamily)
MDEGVPFPDERLELIFTCCHPALALDAQVALTLRTLGGCRPRRSHVPSWSRLRR